MKPCNTCTITMPSYNNGEEPYPNCCPNAPYFSWRSKRHKGSPSTVNAASMPVPVIAHTCVPSVTGEGDESFCLLIFSLPVSRPRSHKTLPSFLSRHNSKTCPPTDGRSASEPCPPSSPLDGVMMNILSPQMTGVLPLQEGRAAFHTIFSVSLHEIGNPDAST